MGDIRDLKQVFNEGWDWSTSGEEWSTWWGGTPALWYGGLLPRIHAFLPASTILEIAPGFGRWTQYLKDLSQRLILVDLADKCIDACRERFSSATNIEYHVNDGRSLPMIADQSIDFVFSWDSLVHADVDIIRDYISEMRRILSPDGVGFIHHSNVRAHERAHNLAMKTPPKMHKMLVRLVKRGVLLDVFAWRSATVSAADVEQMCREVGLACVSQEVFNWEHGRYLTEAITVFTQPGSRWARDRRYFETRSFRTEAHRTAELYSATGFGRLTESHTE